MTRFMRFLTLFFAIGNGVCAGLMLIERNWALAAFNGITWAFLCWSMTNEPFDA